MYTPLTSRTELCKKAILPILFTCVPRSLYARSIVLSIFLTVFVSLFVSSCIAQRVSDSPPFSHICFSRPYNATPSSLIFSMRCPFSPALRQPCFSIAAIQHRVNTSVSLSNLPPAFPFFTCVLPLPLCLPDSCFGVCSNIFSDFRITGVTLSNCKEFFELMDNNLIAFIDETLSVLAFVVGSRRPASILSVNIGGATPRRSFHSTYGNL